jgi:hypothetical protein
VRSHHHTNIATLLFYTYDIEQTRAALWARRKAPDETDPDASPRTGVLAAAAQCPQFRAPDAAHSSTAAGKPADPARWAQPATVTDGDGQSEA